MSNNIAKINLSAQEISYLRENVQKMPKISPELEMKHLKAFHKKAPGVDEFITSLKKPKIAFDELKHINGATKTGGKNILSVLKRFAKLLICKK